MVNGELECTENSLKLNKVLPVSRWSRYVIILHVSVFNVHAITEESNEKQQEKKERYLRNPAKNKAEDSHFSTKSLAQTRRGKNIEISDQFESSSRQLIFMFTKQRLLVDEVRKRPKYKPGKGSKSVLNVFFLIQNHSEFLQTRVSFVFVWKRTKWPQWKILKNKNMCHYQILIYLGNQGGAPWVTFRAGSTGTPPPHLVCHRKPQLRRWKSTE